MCIGFINAYSDVQIYYIASSLNSENYLYLTWDTNDSKFQLKKCLVSLLIKLIILINNVANNFEIIVSFKLLFSF